MTRDEILAKVQETFCDLLNNDDIVLSEEMGPNEVEGWNSLALAQILTELEYENKFRFTLKELMSIKNVGNILDAIEAHLSK